MRRLAAVPLCALLLITACSEDGSGTPENSTSAGASTPDPIGPDAGSTADGWQVEVVADGLAVPWDLAVLPDGDLLVTERKGALSLVSGGDVTEIDADLDDVYATGEAGLMGIALSSDFADSGEFFVCAATTHGDVRVISFALSEDRQAAERQDVVVDGLPLNDSGRHSGCRLLIGPDGMLYVGTGDAAQGENPQDLTSLGGKVLRVDPATGEAPADNPFIDSEDQATRLIYTWGHRNVQGLAVQPGTQQIYSVEHGPDVDDEVNLLEPGANYGWDPVGDGDYDESVPMTDTSIDDAVPAVWSTGEPTLALSGATFLDGAAWGEAEGALAIAALKGSALYLLEVDSAAAGASAVPELDGEFGRLRSVVSGGDGVVYVTTSNKNDDKILKVTA